MSTDLTKYQDFIIWILKKIPDDLDWFIIVCGHARHISHFLKVLAYTINLQTKIQPFKAEKPLHDVKIKIWSCFATSFIIGPHFFEEIYGDISNIFCQGKQYEALHIK